MEEIALGLVWYVVLLLSLTVHEAGHAWAAERGGDPTAYLGGQLSLDPRPHIRREPLGTVLFPLLSYGLSGWMMGWASAPYDPLWADRHPRRAAWMSLAGPAANLGLVLLAAVAIRLGMLAGVFTNPELLRFGRVVEATAGGAWPAAALLLGMLFSLNLLLFTFNLLPLPPLDGSGVLGLLLPEEAARRFRSFFATSGLALVGLIAAWMLFGEVFPPIYWAAIGLLYPEARYGD